MAIFRKTWVKLTVFGLMLLVLYLSTRLANLTKIPIFTDEAIYIRWSQIGSRDANWRFISLVDGKQPLFTWLMMADLKLIHDPLVAGRMISVGAGFISMVGIWLLAYELFKNRRISFISSLLYLLSPFTLMYDRLAMYDSLVATLTIWNLYLAILLVRHLRLDLALIFGMTLGLGMLNKTSGFLSLYLMPLTLLLFDWGNKDQKRETLKRFLKWLFLVGIAAFISQALYSVLRLSPLFQMIAAKDAVFVYPVREWLVHPFKFVEGNLRGELDWLWRYLTLPVFLTALWQAVTLKPKMFEKIELFAWWIAPFMALASFGRVLYPRFILFMAMPLLVLAAVSIDQLIAVWGKKIVGLALILVLFFPSIYTDYFIITNPIYAPIPFADKGQLIDDWPAGWGIAEVNAFLINAAKKGKIYVYTEGTFGLLPYALEIYLVDNPNIKIKGIWPLLNDVPADVAAVAKEQQTYLVLNQTQVPPSGWPLKLIAQYQKGGHRESKLRFYQIVSLSKP